VLLKRGRQVQVFWEDIVDYAGSDWNDDYTEYPTASTSSDGRIAFNYKRGRSVLHLSRDWDEDNNHPKSVVAIPTGCISSIVDQKTGEELWDRKLRSQDPPAPDIDCTTDSEPD
jgi:hypothetical protein